MSDVAAQTNDAPVLRVKDLVKTYRIGFFRKKVEAVRGLSFQVEPGEIFGLLGPNGAGKTTTIKSVLRLIFPTSGEVSIFGAKTGDREVMHRVGYLPENPYLYQYLKPVELLGLCGKLFGMDSKASAARADELLDRLGLAHAKDRQIGKFSKGMMQRVGLAQALLHDPEFLVLDEPMSGLDPIGRKQVREVLVEERERGKTLMVTSHILSDVEMLCDRVAIMKQGEMAAEGTIDELLRPEVRRVSVSFGADDLASLQSALNVESARIVEGVLQISLDGEEAVAPLLKKALGHGARVLSVEPERETLEDLFLRDAVDASGKDSKAPTSSDGVDEPSPPQAEA